jgi:hypothetical protein
VTSNSANWSPPPNARRGRRDVPNLTRPVSQAPWELEVLPVFVDQASTIRWLVRTSAATWRLPGRAAASPQEVMREALVVFGIGPFVAHSTSWRYDDQARVLVLTYLLLLPTLHAPPPAGFEEQAVGRESLARGELAAPPADIETTQVMEHALRHLAWLAVDDPAISRLLGPRWIAALKVYAPEPFRSIQDVFSVGP